MQQRQIISQIPKLPWGPREPLREVADLLSVNCEEEVLGGPEAAPTPHHQRRDIQKYLVELKLQPPNVLLCEKTCPHIQGQSCKLSPKT